MFSYETYCCLCLLFLDVNLPMCLHDIFNNEMEYNWIENRFSSDEDYVMLQSSCCEDRESPRNYDVTVLPQTGGYKSCHCTLYLAHSLLRQRYHITFKKIVGISITKKEQFLQSSQNCLSSETSPTNEVPYLSVFITEVLRTDWVPLQLICFYLQVDSIQCDIPILAVCNLRIFLF